MKEALSEHLRASMVELHEESVGRKGTGFSRSLQDSHTNEA